MKLKEIIKEFPHTIITGHEFLDREVDVGYCSDLLSRVMSQAPKNALWITVQTHTNIVAVATLLEIPCIVIPEDIPIDPKTVEKAECEEIVIISSPLTAFEISGKLYNMGIGRK
jgi:serine kinase of HPr protein (carbohydrate metabolism regulator)